jgi:predicted nucleic acid-binding protein
VSTLAAAALLGEVGRGAYDLEPFTRQDVAEAASVAGRYASLGIGLADASIVVLARRWSTSDILTLDERHFRALTGPGGAPFRLLPVDHG